jgi:hypothetical protein
LVRWNTPIVRAYYLKEAFQLFWDYQQPKRAADVDEFDGSDITIEDFRLVVVLCLDHLVPDLEPPPVLFHHWLVRFRRVQEALLPLVQFPHPQ